MAEPEMLFGEGPAACPFVALENDRDRRSDEPDHRHRCYAEPDPQPRAIAHQRAYCLSPGFSGCPIFQDWAVRAAARPVPLAPAASAPTDEGAGSHQSPGPGDKSLAASSTPGQGQGQGSWAAPPPWTRDAAGPSEPQQMAAFDADDAPLGSAADVRRDEPAIAPPLMRPLSPAVPPTHPPAGARPPDAIERLPSLPVDRTGDAERDARAEEERQRRMEAERERRAEEERRRRADDERRERERAAGAAAVVPPFLAGRAETQPVTGGHGGAPAGGPPLPPSRPQAGPAAQSGRGAGADASRQQALPAGRDATAGRRDDLVPIWEREPIHAYPTLRRRLSLRGSGDLLSTLTTLFAVLAILALIVFAVIAIPSFLGGGGGGPRPTGPVVGTSASPRPSVVTTPPPATPVAQETPRTYTIQSGDSLFAVGLEFGVTVDQLLAANPQITDPNIITVGQVIVIPEPDFPVPGASGRSPAP